LLLLLLLLFGMAASPVKSRVITVFRNGDGKLDKGIRMVLHPTKMRDFEQVCLSNAPYNIPFQQSSSPSPSVSNSDLQSSSSPSP
jgi:hypothetical protein